ncbi:hypothetical protein BD626DRAFT_546297 [Schizophyllum amplum]|uniref:F-box domain-containing protein n=1 Tax=Schizophyllum amplum TaxID=97359 RepID=A0A550CM82_9AGAR|nr:hypothetical protein BD626DRAFT_546297 [Auriculariopsis ampla]
MAMTEAALSCVRNAAAAAHGIPNEVLAKIFEICVQDDAEQADRMLSMLEQICRRWRSVLLGTPTLWTHITLQHPNLRPRNQLSLMSAYLRRSGGCPLYVWLTDADDLDDFLPLLQSHANRLRYLSVNGRTFEGLHRIAASLRDLPAPELRRLQFTINSHPPSRAVQQSLMPMSMFKGGTPKLTHVHVQLAGALDVFPLQVPETTASLKITPYPTTIPLNGLRNVLYNLHNLTELTVHGDLVPVHSMAYTADVVEAPQLRRLIQFVGRRHCTSLWPAVLRAPTLEHITLFAREAGKLRDFCDDGPMAMATGPFPEQPALRSFTLAARPFDNHRCDDSIWGRCRAMHLCSQFHDALVSVRHLTLVNICRGGEVLEDMLALAPDGPRMPHIQVVDVSSPSIDWERLRHALELRKSEGHPLHGIGLPCAVFDEGAAHLLASVEVVRQFSEAAAIEDPFFAGQPMTGL